MMNPRIEKFQHQKMGTIVVTGAAGFIGFHVAHRLLSLGKQVLGVDSLCDYYDVSLKEARLAQLKKKFGDQFHFVKANIQDKEKMQDVWRQAHPKITHVVHLAAQAGVRYSLIDPYSYVETNVMGHLVLLEMARHHGPVENFVYASTASVYGSNTKIPFSEDDVTESPMAVYAATKKCDELMSRAYAHLFRIPLTGLRFFSVYGPWGRPDMALFIFTKNIIEGKPIPVFNQGRMKRDFTYVDDIVEGVLAALASPQKDDGTNPPHRIYNLGNSHMENLSDYIALIEQYVGKKATIDYKGMQAGDIPAALSDISRAQAELGFQPKVRIQEGVRNFVEWYKGYYGV
ncbi:MAG: SDR family NAD(P)-dependent oxidoreductase [Alphaproteobacteria bacterium]